MKNKEFVAYIMLLLLSFTVFACSNKKQEKKLYYTKFYSDSLHISEDYSARKLRGQVLYIPVYSNVPYAKHGRKYDLSAFIAVHNTDFKKDLKITKVLFFNNEGKLVSNYLQRDTILQPLEAVNFFVPESGQNGTGANFIVEWVADTLINEPLVESVMIGLKSSQGVSFLSTGKVIREMK